MGVETIAVEGGSDIKVGDTITVLYLHDRHLMGKPMTYVGTYERDDEQIYCFRGINRKMLPSNSEETIVGIDIIDNEKLKVVQNNGEYNEFGLINGEVAIVKYKGHTNFIQDGYKPSEATFIDEPHPLMSPTTMEAFLRET